MAWIGSAGVWLRSRSSADLAYATLPAHLFVLGEVADGRLMFSLSTHWPGRAAHGWSTGSARFDPLQGWSDGSAASAVDRLVGPNYGLAANWVPGSDFQMSLDHAWRGFSANGGRRHAEMADGTVRLDAPQRGWPFGPDSGEPPISPLIPYLDSSIPVWAIPAVATLPIVALAATMGRAALRSRRRAAEGRCVGCGYDLRHRQERCPECGAASVT